MQPFKDSFSGGQRGRDVSKLILNDKSCYTGQCSDVSFYPQLWVEIRLNTERETAQ